MCRPPPANPLHVAGPLEVVGVARLPQPAGLALLFAHPPARGRRTVALAPPVPGVRNKGRVAMQALGVRGRSSHRLEEDASPTPNPTHPLPEKPQGRKKRRRKKRLRPIRKKTPRKNTPPHPVFKPPTSSGFQLGADSCSQVLDWIGPRSRERGVIEAQRNDKTSAYAGPPHPELGPLGAIAVLVVRHIT
jgi:hypothetical protein